MSRVGLFASTLALLLSSADAWTAEDDSAHQPAQYPKPHAEEPERQQQHSVRDATAPDPHGQHAEQTDSKPTASERRHIPPDPPQLPLHDMSNEQMIELMQMEDNASFSMALLDELEWHEINNRDAVHWDGQFWYGNNYDKAWLRSEGSRVAGEHEGTAELFWDRIVTRWWHVQAGVRHDFGEGPARTWAAFGLQGLAPHWFEVEATAYIGEHGRTATRLSAEYELLLTQRLILQPKIEFDLYGKDDPRNGIGSGLANSEVGLRLRYEIRREFAPYIGVVWTRSYGETADLARVSGDDDDDLLFVAGVRSWF